MCGLLLSCCLSELAAADVYFELSEEKVCQFFAELLLRPAGKVCRMFGLYT